MGLNRRKFITTSAIGAAGALVVPYLAKAAMFNEKELSEEIPMLTLNNGVKMPTLGFGTYKTLDKTTDSVREAIANGYRLIDTGAYYKNEIEVGEGIRQSGISRSELFLTTKLWIADYGNEKTRKAFEKSLQNFGTDYIDLYLLHYPTPTNFKETIESYRIMERLLSEGRIRAIGVSNFSDVHLINLMKETSVTPAINQIEIHPWFIQKEMIAINKQLGIITQAWSPIGGIFINHPKNGNPERYLLQDPVIVDLAKKLNRTPAQVVLRWHYQNGVVVIPKSVHPNRIISNKQIFDFELSDAEMKLLDSITPQERGGTDPEIFDMNLLNSRSNK
ncbi:MAG TPA: aldo/keto reductase [Agriterribacter sp.]|nr:aldo/keto reductase [Agriterribacter sp.]